MSNQLTDQQYIQSIVTKTFWTMVAIDLVCFLYSGGYALWAVHAHFDKDLDAIPRNFGLLKFINIGFFIFMIKTFPLFSPKPFKKWLFGLYLVLFSIGSFFVRLGPKTENGVIGEKITEPAREFSITMLTLPEMIVISIILLFIIWKIGVIAQRIENEC